jgi:hypothetical protein
MDAYPILTEEVGYPPSPLAVPGGAPADPSKGDTLGPVVMKALQDVLGWKVKPNDGKGFLGALNQSFQLATVEGHVEANWTPRTYAVQTDLSGGITGAQASIYTMAKTLADQAFPLIDGLYPLDPAADVEYVAAIKGLVRSQLTELVNELGYLGGPRVLRVNQYLQMLLGGSIDNSTGGFPPGGPTQPSGYSTNYHGGTPPFPDPQAVYGSVGNLRDVLGLYIQPAPSFSNTIEDEQDVTNFRIIADYILSLQQSWQSNYGFFNGSPSLSPFLGTQLVIISRQLSVVSEAVDEVRFVLDSVFIGPSERQTLLLTNLPTLTPPLPQMFLEDILSWIQRYASEEAPDIIQRGGRFALGEDVTSMLSQLGSLVQGAISFATASSGAMGTPRVVNSLAKLGQLIQDLTNLVAALKPTAYL